MKRLFVTLLMCSVFLNLFSQIIGTVDITKIKSEIVSIKLNSDYPFYFTYAIGKTVKIDFKTYIIHNKRSYKPKSSTEWIQFFNAYGWELVDKESIQKSSVSSTRGTVSNQMYSYNNTKNLNAFTSTSVRVQKTLSFKKVDKLSTKEIDKKKSLAGLKEAKEMLELGVITQDEYNEKVVEFRNTFINGITNESEVSENKMIDEKVKDEQLQKKLKSGFKEIDSYTKLKEGYKVLYKVDKKYFSGNVKFKNSLGNYTIINIKKYNDSKESWESEEIEYVSIPLNQIIAYKL